MSILKTDYFVNDLYNYIAIFVKNSQKSKDDHCGKN